MQPYRLKFDPTGTIVHWSELQKWGYSEANQRSAQMIQMVRDLDKPWAFIIGNEEDGQFTDYYRTYETIEMVFNRALDEPNFSGVFGVVVSNILFEVLAAQMIPVIFNVHCEAHHDVNVVYQRVRNCL